MKLKNVNKTKYRQRLNRVIILFITGFALSSVAFGQLLIAIFAESSSESNFNYNLTGVILGLLLSTAILQKRKTSEYFQEIYYVWCLKQIHTKIYNKINKIKTEAFEQGNIEALNVLAFYYHSIIQVYELDDNTITISKAVIEQNKVLNFASKHSIKLHEQEIDESVLNDF